MKINVTASTDSWLRLSANPRDGFRLMTDAPDPYEDYPVIWLDRNGLVELGEQRFDDRAEFTEWLRCMADAIDAVELVSP